MQLSTLLNNLPLATVEQALNNFSRCKDDDLTFFLTERAIKFDQLCKSKTFLLLDEDLFTKGTISIVAYFSLAIQVISLPPNLSSNAIKRMDGLSSRIHGKKITDLSVFLIGQLAKCDTYADKITGAEVLRYALSELCLARNIIGGRVVMVDCKNEDKLLKFYSNNGFKHISNDPETGLEQLIHILK